jgi:predicted TPR repeat methyltransferase
MTVHDFAVQFPHQDTGLEQDEEFCILEDGACTRKIRFHDYHEIYQVEGLYEHLFYDVLRCNSPATVCGKLMEVVGETEFKPEELRVLDVGAGNGMVGEELKQMGADTVVGIDIIPEAKEAQVRDRPDVYEAYLVQDLTKIEDTVKDELMAHNLNCMTTVAALGFGDIPPMAFSEGFNLIEDRGVVAFNIRDKFVEESASSAFSDLIETIESEDIFDLRVKERYRHRLDVDGNPIHYYVYAGVKNSDIPSAMVERFH